MAIGGVSRRSTAQRRVETLDVDPVVDANVAQLNKNRKTANVKQAD